MKNGKSNLPSLTSLRFFAAAAIFALHSAQIPGFPTSNFGGFVLNHGVSFFYVLSGFILHYNYRDRPTGWGRFMWLRFARIWPLHVVGLAVALALRWSDLISWTHAYLTPYSVAAVVFLMQAWSPHNTTYFAINGVSWSISAEMFFYACFLPLSIAFVRRPLWAIAGAVLFHVLYLVVTWHEPSMRPFADALYSVNPAFRILEFVIGIAACEVWTRSRTVKLGNGAATAIEVSAIVAVLIADRLTGSVASMLKPLDTPVQATAYVMWVDPFFAALLCVFASNRGMVSKAMGWRPLMVLGEISFALYLLHQPIQWFVGAKLAALGSVGMLLVSIAATLAAAAAAHYWIEKPVYKLASLRRLANRHIDDRTAVV
jgi:peptidoglycan/LPS O-acetylase OafA/YrhL